MGLALPHPLNPLSPLTPHSHVQCYIDGPYGTPTRRIFASEHAVLIGAGIGITPFASILQSILYRWVDRLWPCLHPGQSPERYPPPFLPPFPCLPLPFLSSPAPAPALSWVSSLHFLMGLVLPPHPPFLSPALSSGVLGNLLLTPNSKPPSLTSPQAPEEKARLPQLSALLVREHPG